MSLLLAQQQHSPIWMRAATMEKPVAIHMKANISAPSDAPMFTSWTDVKALRMMMNITVAMTVATVIRRAAMKVKIDVASAVQREKIARGARNIMTKARQVPDRNKPNIQCEAMRMRSRILITSAGSVTAIKKVSKSHIK